MCCHVDKVGVAVQDEAHALAHNAVRTTFFQDVHKQLKRSKSTPAPPSSDEMPMTRIQVPADGWCLWHSLNAAHNTSEYMRVPRYSSGYAAHPRQVAQEIEKARALRDQALQAESISSQARSELEDASCVDVALLDCVGRALDLAIRCTVHDTAAWLVIWYRLEWLFWDERLHTYIYRRVNTQRYQARLSCMLYPYSKCHFEHTHRRHIYIYIYIYVYTHMHCRQTVEAKKWVSTPLDAMWGVRRSSPDVHVLFEWIQAPGSTKLCGHYSVLIHDSTQQPFILVQKEAKHFSECVAGAAGQLWAETYQYAHEQLSVADAPKDKTQDGISCIYI